MAKTVEQNVTCPNCGATGTFTTWLAFEDDSKEPRDLLSAGELASYTCPQCGAHVQVAYSCLYHDNTHNATVFYSPDEAEANRIAQLFSAADAGAGAQLPAEFQSANTRRIVSSHDELAEKVRAFEDGLDDQVLEILKVMALLRVRDEFQVTGDEPAVYDGLAENGDVLVKLQPKDDDAWYQVPVPHALYDEAASSLAKQDAAEAGFKIDRAWAARQLNG